MSKPIVHKFVAQLQDGYLMTKCSVAVWAWERVTKKWSRVTCKNCIRKGKHGKG
jgi:hypothetical protein